jgi:hypothetical protein
MQHFGVPLLVHGAPITGVPSDTKGLHPSGGKRRRGMNGEPRAAQTPRPREIGSKYPIVYCK